MISSTSNGVAPELPFTSNALTGLVQNVKLAKDPISGTVRNSAAWAFQPDAVTSAAAAASAAARVSAKMVNAAKRTVALAGTVTLYVHAMLSPVRMTDAGCKPAGPWM